MIEKNQSEEMNMELLKTLVEESSNAVIVRDFETCEILYANQEAQKLSKIAVAEAPSLSFDKYFDEEFDCPTLGRHYLLREKLLHWNNRTVRVEYIIDQTQIHEANKSLQNLIDNIPGGIGIYNVYPEGKIQQVYLNDGYYALIGADRENRKEYLGFDVVNAIYENDQKMLLEKVRNAIQNDTIVNADLRVKQGNGEYRWLNIHAKTVVKTDAYWTMYVTYSDIDTAKRLQLQQQTNQQAIDLAKKRGDISIWSFNLDKRVINQNLFLKGAMGYPIVIENVPDYFMENKMVCEEDEERFRNLYKKLYDGAEKADETIRLYNHETGKFDWLHMYYQRVYNESEKDRMAVGFALNVNQQQEHLTRYQAEQRLRRKLFENSVLYYQANLTTQQLEEYKDSVNPVAGIELPIPITPAFGEKIVSEVEEDFKDTVRNLFPSRLVHNYEKGETTVSCEYRRFLKGQGFRWVRGTAIMMQRPENNEVVAFVHIQNIDREKKHNMALSSVLDEELESIILMNIKDYTLDIVRENRQWESHKEGDVFIYDPTFKKVLTREIFEEDKDRCEKFMDLQTIREELKKNPVFSITYRIPDKSGKIERKKVRIMYLDKYHEEIVFARRDITDLYEEEQRNKQKLEQAIEEANIANEAKSRFLSNVSHDMRTPLNAILGFSDKELTDDTSEVQKMEYLNQIHEAGEYLLGIINNVLDMSKIESNKMILSPAAYSMDEFKDTMQTIFQEQCSQKGITFIIETKGVDSCRLFVDRVRFNQIFVNLLSNAVKYTAAGGKVELLMERLQTRNQSATIQFIIRDNGIGMSKEFIPRAFDSFTQEIQKTREQNTQGTGLGLAIVKQLVELMKGTIELESELGKGTTYRIELDIPLAEDVERAEQQKGQYDLSGIRILLCEDHPINTRVAKMLLEKRKCIVDTAEDGCIGLEKFNSSPTNFYDIILMDIRMPKMDGLQATEQIRKLDRADAKNVPIIAMTANAFAEDIETTKKAGMNGHLSKPIEPLKLYETVALHTGRKNASEGSN